MTKAKGTGVSGNGKVPTADGSLPTRRFQRRDEGGGVGCVRFGHSSFPLSTFPLSVLVICHCPFLLAPCLGAQMTKDEVAMTKSGWPNAVRLRSFAISPFHFPLASSRGRSVPGTNAPGRTDRASGIAGHTAGIRFRHFDLCYAHISLCPLHSRPLESWNP